MSNDRRWTKSIASFVPFLHFLLLIHCFIPSHSLTTGTTTAPPATTSSSRTASSWTIPKNVKFGKLSNLEFLPIQDDDGTNMKDETTTALVEESQRIKVATAAIGLNFADVFTVLGLYKAANLVRTGNNGKDTSNSGGGILDPFVPGIEFAGVVLEANGDFTKGDRVFGFTRFGAYSDIVSTRPEFIRKIPNKWSFEQGAAFLVNALTAWHGLVNVGGMPDLLSKHRKKNDNGNQKDIYVVVVHSASGGVGLWASEIAARRGAVVVGVVGSEEKKDTFMKRVGTLCNGDAAQCIVRSNNARDFDRDLAEACQKARHLSQRSSGGGVSSTAAQQQQSLPFFSTCLQTAEAGYGADLVMECYGGKYFAPSMEVINPGGSLSTYGATTYNDSGLGEGIPFVSLILNYIRRPRVDPGELTGRNIRVGGFNLIFLTENIDLLVTSLDGCVQCLCRNDEDDDDSIHDFDEMMEQVNPPLVGSVFPFRVVDGVGGGGAVDALKALRSGNTVGKVVLDNNDNPALC
mmetsp:Transcript_9245/g.13693  ORF Transcript_9245/g.13693 Transcript_9245/m.13693 type:complete len:518 (-) Transcript_9245:84-1637(-)